MVWHKEVRIEDEQAHKHFKQYIDSDCYINDFFLTLEARIIGPEQSLDVMCGSCGSGKKLELTMEFLERDLEGELMRRADDMVSKYKFSYFFEFFLGFFS
jgi:hypothetical protein